MKRLPSLGKRASFVVCLFLFAAGANVNAQSTIFDKPSADVQPSRSVLLEADFITHFASYKDGGYQTYGPRVVVGLPGHTEVGVNVFYTRTSPAAPVELQPNFKWRFYNNDNLGVSLAAGFLITVPVTRRSENKTTAMIYLVGSKTLKRFKEPTFTFGGYSLVGPFEEGTDKQGIIVGYNQPVTEKLSFQMDWASGNNDNGYVTAAAGFQLSERQNISAGYSFGNQGRGNNFLGVYYGYTFGKTE
jgi:hypothetical protein